MKYLHLYFLKLEISMLGLTHINFELTKTRFSKKRKEIIANRNMHFHTPRNNIKV